ncbi:hypothetical protein [Enhygromyxa salina]|uniref:hypothetical protein n=1 Tax=Enhygromyxa salina TaxID=215803 RepID=UPI0011BAB180|nr:hypothetical protein [Enhygromyxa salina]
MEKLAAYRLEHDVSDDAAARAVEIEAVVGLLRKWLKQKRADDPEASQGEFKSERSGDSGYFGWQRAGHGERSWQMLRLVEDLSRGRRFETSVSVTDTGRSVIVYATLASGLSSSAVTPVPTDAKCPRPVRWILDMHGAWYHGATKIRGMNRVEGREAGRHFAEEIRFANRTLPLIVISEDEGELSLPKLDRELGRALMGLANVTVVDDGASWGLTDVLGKENSCYWGAVRVYWPRYDVNRHPFWPVRRLLDSAATADRFEAQLRNQIMRISGRSAVRPPEIDDIRREADRARMQNLQAQLKSSAEWEDFAETYSRENEELRREKEDLEEENARLCDALQNAEARLGAESPGDQAIEPEPPDADSGPKPGDIRYYKKVGYTRKLDKMVETSACGHSAWQAANKADKAKKGIERYVGRRNWAMIRHCGSCTGGGMWKVRW